MAISRTPYICASCSRSLSTLSRRSTAPATHGTTALFSSSSLARQDEPVTTFTPTQTATYHPPRPDSISVSQTEPRWKQTPPGMRQPLRLRPLPRQPLWKVNTEQEPLDEMYDRLIGRTLGASMNGRDALPENIKWLAVTHKSFEHGAQGFNDKLAFLGKRIVDLQTTLALHRLPLATDSVFPGSSVSSAFVNPPAADTALEGAENMTVQARHRVLARTRLSDVATRYGVQGVMRWKPRKSDNLIGSGIQTVAAHTLYSIVGALALHRGGEVATTVARERILRPLGLR